jgi:hypothetical protein
MNQEHSGRFPLLARITKPQLGNMDELISSDQESTACKEKN